MMPDVSIYTLGVKNFVEIALSRTVFGGFFAFTLKFKMVTKNDGKIFLSNHTISHSFKDKWALASCTGIQDGRQTWWEHYFGQKLQDQSAYT